MNSIFTDEGYPEAIKKDKEEIARFKAATPKGSGADRVIDSRQRIVSKHLRKYLEDRPAPSATVSLAFAFDEWRRLDGVSREMREFLRRIPADEGVGLENPWDQERLWDEIGSGIIGAFTRDGQRSEGLAVLEECGAIFRVNHLSGPRFTTVTGGSGSSTTCSLFPPTTSLIETDDSWASASASMRSGRQFSQ